MMKNSAVEKWYRETWQKVYDEAFCNALDEGREMHQAAEAADQAVLDTAVNMGEVKA